MDSHLLLLQILALSKGEILSPILFNLYINDIPDNFYEDCDSVKLDNYSFNTLMFSGDLIILSTSEKGLHNYCLNKLNTYCTKWKLKVNTVNTVFLFLTKQANFHILFLNLEISL